MSRRPFQPPLWWLVAFLAVVNLGYYLGWWR